MMKTKAYNSKKNNDCQIQDLVNCVDPEMAQSLLSSISERGDSSPEAVALLEAILFRCTPEQLVEA